jgi:uncharacterized protein
LNRGESVTGEHGPTPQVTETRDASHDPDSPLISPADETALEVASLDGGQEDRLRGALKELLEKSQDIDAAAVVSMDGFVMASILPAEYEEDRLGAMSAALLSLGERTALELGRGELAQVFVEGTHGYVFLLAAGEDAVLTAIVKRGSKLGLVLYDIRNAAKNIAAIIETNLQVEYE